MDWPLLIADSCNSALLWLTGFAIVFAVLVRLMPCNPGQYWWSNPGAAVTDLLYSVVMPVVGRLTHTLLLTAGVALLFGGVYPESRPLAQLPLWLQCLAILVLQDIYLYWMHRLFHTRRAWSFHAIHHSPRVVDWLSSARFHVVNKILSFTVADVAILLLGFSPEALLILVPFEACYSALVHANLNWTFGPFRYVFASPVFHRWHHTTQADAIDKNFASTFPALDLLFGTFHMPADRLPETFGNGDPDFPEDFWGQLLHPFRRKKTALAEAVPETKEAA